MGLFVRDRLGLGAIAICLTGCATATVTPSAPAAPTVVATTAAPTAASPTPLVSATPGPTAPNVDFATASALALGNPAAVVGDAAHDTYFKVTVPAGPQDGLLSLSTETAGRALTLYNARQAALDVAATPRQEPVTAGATYYVKLAASAQPTQLTATFVPVVDSLEPNNDFGTATPLVPGTATTFFNFAGFDTLQGHDVDFFTFSAPTGTGTVRIQVTDASTADAPQRLEYTLYDATHTQLANFEAEQARASIDSSVTVSKVEGANHEYQPGGTFFLKLDDALGGRSAHADSVLVTSQYKQGN